jgi:hypothetical protein
MISKRVTWPSYGRGMHPIIMHCPSVAAVVRWMELIATLATMTTTVEWEEGEEDEAVDEGEAEVAMDVAGEVEEEAVLVVVAAVQVGLHPKLLWP